jgi:hypothetical protein
MTLQKFNYNKKKERIEIDVSKKEYKKIITRLGNLLGLEEENFNLEELEVLTASPTVYTEEVSDIDFLISTDTRMINCKLTTDVPLINYNGDLKSQILCEEIPLKDVQLWQHFRIDFSWYYIIGIAIPGRKTGELRYVDVATGKPLLQVIPKGECPNFRNKTGHICYDKVKVFVERRNR